MKFKNSGKVPFHALDWLRSEIWRQGTPERNRRFVVEKSQGNQRFTGALPTFHDHSFLKRWRSNMGLGKGALLWLIGVPIPIIILLVLFWR